MSGTQWLQFSAPRAKRKRAELACETCHSKKIRCDLQARTLHGGADCTNCISSGKECRVRIPKRDKIRQAAGNEQLQPLTPPGDGSGGLLAINNASNPSTENETDIEVPPSLTHSSNAQIYQARSSIAGFGQPAIESPTQRHAERESVVSNNASQDWRASETGSVRHLVDTGYLQVYGPENDNDARSQAVSAKKQPDFLDVSQPDLQQSFAETYSEYCYPWCPVLDRATLFSDLARSPLLDNALALVGSHIQPPMIPHAGPGSYYDRARRRFYDDEEPDLLTSLIAVSLFYWWSPRPPSVVHRHSSWWWTSVVIKHAQQAGWHRESEGRPSNEVRLRRRIWWTAFARERLTAICQGKPCVIDVEDCNIPEPTLDDFPELQDKTDAEIFIHWVRLCAIIGRVAKYLSRSSNCSPASFPSHLAHELIDWIRSLPPHLKLPIGMGHTTNFNRHVHQLHLPYLTIIIVLYLKRNSSQSMPQALPPAIMAATCLARILKDILIRSGTRGLMGITCWYCGMGFIPLLQAARTEHLRAGADADLDILTLAVKQLKNMWATANVFEQGFARLRQSFRAQAPIESSDQPNPLPTDVEEDLLHGGIDWIEYFPFVTTQTSPVAGKLLAQKSVDLFLFPDLDDSSMLHFQDLFEGLDSWTDPKLFM
ncbi:hypothetical protein RBB50_006522 [Rhinocladiella similis]